MGRVPGPAWDGTARKTAQAENILVPWLLLGSENYPPSDTHFGSTEESSHLFSKMKTQLGDFQFFVELSPTSFVIFF